MKDTFLERDLARRNNFGIMRLVLALFVIVSHMFAAFGGNWEEKEILMRATGNQMDLGALAVNSFFAISGYLITMSWMRTPRVKTYLLKRGLRIYPGFIVASIVSILVFAPLAGASWSSIFAPGEALKSIGRIVLLSAPRVNGTFEGDKWNVLNLSLWTIRYEFICYLLVPLVLILARKHVSAVVTILLASVMIWHRSQGYYLVQDGWEAPIIGSFSIWPKFLTYFIGGMFFAVNRQRIPFRHWIAAVCAVALIVTAIFGGFFIAMATAGIYLLFYLAHVQNVPSFAIGDRVDLSYGTYLYGWPVEKTLAFFLRGSIGPWTTMALAIPIVLGLATLSWFFVEAPFLRQKKKLEGKSDEVHEEAMPPRPPAATGNSAMFHYRRSA